METSGVRFQWLMGQSELPETWVGLAEAVREVTGEVAERDVLANIAATLASMTVIKLNQQEQVMPAEARACRDLIYQGTESLERCRRAMSTWSAGAVTGSNVFDFELIKAASMLTSGRAIQSRIDARYPVKSELWAVDPSIWNFPY